MDTKEIDHILTTTRSVRKRLDLERPVSREVILECLRLAVQAPTGGNRQGWRFIVIDDPRQKRALAGIYRDVCDAPFREQLSNATTSGERSAYAGALYLAEVLERVPALVLPCVLGTVQPGVPAAGLYGSILPAVWSFQLALRSRGLGSCYTTVLCRSSEIVAEVLEIPEGITQVALLPVAYTVGTEFKAAQRTPVEELTFFNTWTLDARMSQR